MEHDELGGVQLGGRADAVTDLLSRTDYNGKTTTYGYDAIDRLTGVTPDASTGDAVVSFTYTGTWQRASMTDASGMTIRTG